MKKALLLSALALFGTAAVYAEEYHGFRVNASQQLLDNKWDAALDKPYYDYNKVISVQVLYQPSYRPLTVNADLTSWQHGTTTHEPSTGKFGDLSSNAETHKGTQNYLLELALEKGLLDGIRVTPVMDENGLAYASVPAQYYKATDGSGVLTDVPAEGGDLRVRFYFTSGNRINDAGMAHTEDITGVHLTVDAPSTVRITSDFTQASNTAFTAGEDASANDKLGKIGRVAVFNLPSAKGLGPEDIECTDSPANCYNLFKYKRTSDTYAFPINYVDIVFYGVKPGEKVGWTNYQTLHEGYTANIFANSSGVEGIASEKDAPAVYYNLQGVPVANPVSGQVYIMRRGAAASKVVY